MHYLIKSVASLGFKGIFICDCLFVCLDSDIGVMMGLKIVLARA